MKSAAALKADLESALGSRLTTQLTWRERPAVECVPTGIPEIDAMTGGFPRGEITEIHGASSSGRTSLLLSALAQSTARAEVCAVVDTNDAFDPASAAAAGVDLPNLLWIRCGGNPEHALKAVDMLIQAGGFGVVALDMGDVAPLIARRVPIASWFRLRRAIENTPAVLVVIEREQTLKSCASLIVEMRRREVVWSGVPGCSQLLRAIHFGTEVAEASASRKPAGSERRAAFEAKALG